MCLPPATLMVPVGRRCRGDRSRRPLRSGPRRCGRPVGGNPWQLPQVAAVGCSRTRSRPPSRRSRPPAWRRGSTSSRSVGVVLPSPRVKVAVWGSVKPRFTPWRPRRSRSPRCSGGRRCPRCRVAVGAGDRLVDRAGGRRVHVGHVRADGDAHRRARRVGGGAAAWFRSAPATVTRAALPWQEVQVRSSTSMTPFRWTAVFTSLAG